MIRSRFQLKINGGNTSSVVHVCSSPLFIPDSFSEPFTHELFILNGIRDLTSFDSLSAQYHGFCPQHRQAVFWLLLLVTELAEAKSPTKDHALSETPSSFIQHVNERSLLLNSSFYFRTHSAPAGLLRI
jgi:hypothetical protein